MPVARAIAAFLRYCIDERQLAQHTISAYRQDLTEFQRYFGEARQVADITPEEIVAYHRCLTGQRRLSPATVKRRFACLRTAFTWLIRRKMLDRTPFATIEIQTRLPARLPRGLSAEELRLLILCRKTLGQKCALAAGLLVATGMRVGELASLQLGNIDVTSGLMKILGKGNRERVVFVTDTELWQELRDCVATRPADQSRSQHKLFVGRDGRPVRAAQIRGWIRRLGIASGLNRRLTPHMLRHTAATMLVESGTDIRVVQRLLGHQSIVTTQLYTHVSDQALQSALVRADLLRRFGSNAA